MVVDIAHAPDGQTPEITVSTFFEHIREPLGVELRAGPGGMGRILRTNRIQKPGLALAGFTSYVHGDRVQIMGQTEMAYLETLDETVRDEAVQRLLACKLACVVVTKSLPIPLELLEACEKTDTPLFVTRLTSSTVIRKTIAYLDDLLSPRCSVHGVLVDVNGLGVLITGRSGIGKSECALDLVSRGHRLVADDVVEIRRRGEDLVGQASSIIKDLIEVRGLGILNVSELYGVAATRDHKRIELHIRLESWSEEKEYDRTGLDEATIDILGLKVRSLLIPVHPGRNLSGIVEVAARNLLLMLRGHHAARELHQRMVDMVSGPVAQVEDMHLDDAAALKPATDHIEDEVE